MPVESLGRRLCRYGALLFLLGLVNGALVQSFTNPRMGLSAHLAGVQNGLVLMVFGLLWSQLALSARLLRAACGAPIVGLLLLLVLGCVDPQDRRPGLWLSGESVSEPVEDWSFTRAHREIFIETRTPYWIPHSVTIVCVDLDGRLYVGARRPTEKRWVAYVARDPRVRLAIGGRLYERRLEKVEDPRDREAIYRAYAEKYGWERVPPQQRPEMWYFRVMSSG